MKISQYGTTLAQRGSERRRLSEKFSVYSFGASEATIFSKRGSPRSGSPNNLPTYYTYALPLDAECCGGYRLVVATAKYRISLSLRPGSTFFAVAMRGKRRWPARREYATDFSDSSGARRSRPQPSPAALPFLRSLPANCSTRSGRILRQDERPNQER